MRRGLGAVIIERKEKTTAGRPAYSMHVWDETMTSIPGKNKENGFAKCHSTQGERVWCLTNEMETLVVRRNGKVAIVGNCHSQFLGRLRRDGQEVPVTAFFLVTDGGSDPVIAEILGLKRSQSDGMLDQRASSSDYLAGTAEGRIKEMAAKFLAKRGISYNQTGVPSIERG